MSQTLQVIIYILGGIFFVLFIDTAGAIISRRMRFNYGYLSLLSFTVYILVGYFISGVSGFYMAILASIIIGFIDATAGWKLAQYFKAHIILDKEEIDKLTVARNLKIMLFIAPLFAFIGHLLV